MATECPSLTTLTPTTVLLTLHNVYELQVSTWARTPGTKVKVKCHTGLTLQGQDIVTCLATGDWDLSPLPKCVEPPPTTTTTPPPSMDASLVLMLVLICVMVTVTMVMIILGIALCHSYRRRKKNKLYRYPDNDENSISTASKPHSISRRRREDMHMRTKHTNYHHHSHPQYPDKQNPTTALSERPQSPDRREPPAPAYKAHSPYLEIPEPVVAYQPVSQTREPTKTVAENRAFESDDNFIIRDHRYPLPHEIQRSDEEYTITYVPIKVERNQTDHKATPEVRNDDHDPSFKAITYKRNEVKMNRHRRDLTRKALSAHAPQDIESEGDPQDHQRRPYSDITAYYGGLFYDDTSDAEDEFWNRKIIKRDYFLWRDMPASWNSMRLPRAHYRP